MRERKGKQQDAKSYLRLVIHSFLKTICKTFMLLITVEQKVERKDSHLVQQSLHVTRIIFLNPIVIVILLVGLLFFGWTQYTNASHDFSMPVNNLLPSGSFNLLRNGGVPIGWHLEKGGQLSDALTYQDGYVSGRTLVLTVSHYQSGDMELVTPKISVLPQASYLFKGFYSTSADFDLLIRYFYSNGTSALRLIHSYQSTSGLWATDSYAFHPEAKVDSVQFMYRVSKNGQLQLNNTYFEPNSDVYVAPKQVVGEQLLTNANLLTSGSSPQGWSSYKSGSNKATFAYSQTSSVGPNVAVDVSSFKNGEAKWQPNPIPVSAGQYFQFSFTYKATARADVVAEFALQNGKLAFSTAETLSPASEWTYVTVHFEAPASATEMIPCAIMHSNGSLKTARYALYNVTAHAPIRWSEPLISLTFDDGHMSQFENGASQLHAIGLPGTFYVNPATIDTNGFMNSAQLKYLQQVGNEIASHGYSPIDLTTVNTARLSAELSGSSSYLAQHFGISSPDLATSDSNNDPQVSMYARKYFASLRGIEGGINTRQNFDPYNLKVFYITDHTSIETVESAINQTEMYNGWIIFVYHQIGVSSTGSNADISLSSFQKQIKAIKRSGVTVQTVSNALTAIKKQQT